MYVGENECVKYWLSILNGLENRGVDGILLTCIDGLTGFSEAISSVYHIAVHNSSDKEQHKTCKWVADNSATLDMPGYFR